jgi:hypothetical protein
MVAEGCQPLFVKNFFSFFSKKRLTTDGSCDILTSSKERRKPSMKKLLTIALILALTTIALTACAEVYPATAKVVDVNYDKDIVTVETFTGFSFTFEGCEDWQVGDCASLIMEDNGTEKIFDDEIVMAYYGGWELVNWME